MNTDKKPLKTYHLRSSSAHHSVFLPDSMIGRTLTGCNDNDIRQLFEESNLRVHSKITSHSEAQYKHFEKRFSSI